jgi:hypothetical protein
MCHTVLLIDLRVNVGCEAWLYPILPDISDDDVLDDGEHDIQRDLVENVSRVRQDP